MKTVVLFCSFLLLSLTASSQDAVPKKIYEKNGVKVLSFDFDGLDSYLKNNKSKIKVVNFWATWCAPCVKELPYFEKVGHEYKEQGVEIILVSLDMAKAVDNSLIPFIIRRNLKSTVLHLHDLDADTWINKVDPSWTGAIPATLIITETQRTFYEKTFTYDELQSEITKHLKQ